MTNNVFSRPKKSRAVNSKSKVILIAFFENQNVMHYKIVPAGQIINDPLYVLVLKRLRATIRKKMFRQMTRRMVTVSCFLSHTDCRAEWLV